MRPAMFLGAESPCEDGLVTSSATMPSRRACGCAQIEAHPAARSEGPRPNPPSSARRFSLNPFVHREPAAFVRYTIDRNSHSGHALTRDTAALNDAAFAPPRSRNRRTY